MSLLVGERLAFQFDSTEPNPRQRRWILVTLEYVPDTNTLFIGNAQLLFVHVTNLVALGVHTRMLTSNYLQKEWECMFY